VPREKFLGPGPWRLLPDIRPDLPFTTPNDDPAWLYHDVLVTIDPARGLNNGMPSFWAGNLDQLDLKRGHRVLQVGAGTGYYSAILAELVGERGRLTAVEYDPELAARARDNLRSWKQVDVIAGDGRSHDAGEVDAIVVFAGSTHPAPLWLDRLAPGGQLLMPLTGDNWRGFLLLVTRPTDSDRFEARSVGGVGIFPCAGNRDEEAARRLTHALNELFVSPPPGTSMPDRPIVATPRVRSMFEIPIQALHRGEPGADEASRAWYAGPGFWLERGSAS
jgi:protein-L-isoaspartate(D-aspartate) O-methyltransferase